MTYVVFHPCHFSRMQLFGFKVPEALFPFEHLQQWNYNLSVETYGEQLQKPILDILVEFRFAQVQFGF